MSGRVSWLEAVRLALALGVLAGWGASGCEKSASDTQPALEPCKAVGQRCEYAPGKLGACVLRDGCTSGNCYVCQSQH